MSAESSPKIVIVDESPIRAAILEEGLREAGFTGVVHISEMQSLLSRIYALDPDVILIDLENPSRDVLEQMFQVSRAVRRPIAMFVDQSDAASIQASVDAGVSAYIVDGLKKERIKSILDLLKPENSESGESWFGLGPPLVIAIGFMILGVILMVWRWFNHREFFRRKLEVADPAVLDA